VGTALPVPRNVTVTGSILFSRDVYLYRFVMNKRELKMVVNKILKNSLLSVAPVATFWLLYAVEFPFSISGKNCQLQST
jgi:uncharacterized membrane protein